jgi:hypothetical protein
VNACDSCGTPDLEADAALCGCCADREWDRWLDKHDDIGVED